MRSVCPQGAIPVCFHACRGCFHGRPVTWRVIRPYAVGRPGAGGRGPGPAGLLGSWGGLCEFGGEVGLGDGIFYLVWWLRMGLPVVWGRQGDLREGGRT